MKTAGADGSSLQLSELADTSFWSVSVFEHSSCFSKPLRRLFYAKLKPDLIACCLQSSHVWHDSAGSANKISQWRNFNPVTNWLNNIKLVLSEHSQKILCNQILSFDGHIWPVKESNRHLQWYFGCTFLLRYLHDATDWNNALPTCFTLRLLAFTNRSTLTHCWMPGLNRSMLKCQG